MKRILINKSLTDELRIALVDGARLFDLDSETNEIKILKGSIFKAKVSRVETSLDAAFVFYGAERHGFLPLKELTDDFYEKDDEGKRVCNLKENDEIIVQVLKEERGTKGAALSAQLSLAGRFLVLIPNSSRGGGVSRRISGDERDQVKNIIKQLAIPEGMSVIVRTAGLGRNIEELNWDLDYLLSMWSQIDKSTKDVDSPSLIYSDDKLILRVFRDYYREDIEEILIDDKDVYEEALKFAQSVIPDHANKLKFYDEEIPLFNRYQVESQIESAFQREINLPSGGSIVIDPTEAMVTIDVNSSRATKGKDIEETALATNLEAASEVARQLRLRDLGGLVVIDFIDMQNAENQKKVMSGIKHAVNSDRARVQVTEISRFGLLELSRQRLRPSLNETYDIEHILVRGPKSLGQSILRIASEDAAKENTGEVHIFVPADVASYLLNEKRREIITIENSNKINILVIADPYKSRPYYKVVRVKSSDVKNNLSYKMTPDSPEPDLSWREINDSRSKREPLVKVSAPPRKPIKSDGIFKKIVSIFSKSEASNKSKSKRRRPYKKQNKNNSKRANFDKKRPNNSSSRNKSFRKRNNDNRNTNQKNRKQVSKGVDKQRSKKSLENTPPQQSKKSIEKKTQDKQEIKKVNKSVKPTRAVNDPRYKSE